MRRITAVYVYADITICIWRDNFQTFVFNSINGVFMSVFRTVMCILSTHEWAFTCPWSLFISLRLHSPSASSTRKRKYFTNEIIFIFGLRLQLAKVQFRKRCLWKVNIMYLIMCLFLCSTAIIVCTLSDCRLYNT